MEAALRKNRHYYCLQDRLDTFTNWPFMDGCSCTPENMAAAGFIHIPSENSPDVAQCFFCYKELEGWEPEDEPILEHKKHSSQCAFIAQKKKFDDLTTEEFLKLEKERIKNVIKKQVSQTIQSFKDESKIVRRVIEDFATKSDFN
ncbi:baculoviral IAP repeat-containing protein 5a [Callorhinchus milii]|nr:baculoviral IAP repeat-containing protein 5a [Callorhinchus milii]